MTVVYLVHLYRSYEPGENLGVFSTEAKAQEFIKRYKAIHGNYNDVDVEPYLLDDPAVIATVDLKEVKWVRSSGSKWHAMNPRYTTRSFCQRHLTPQEGFCITTDDIDRQHPSTICSKCKKQLAKIGEL